MTAIKSAYTRSATQVIAPSGDTTGTRDATAITTAVAALPASGGVVTLTPSGPWYVKCGQVSIARSGVYIDAPGVLVNAVGTGDVFRMFDTTNSWPVYGGGITGYPVIDGTSAGAGSAGVHAGDLFQSQWQVFVQNFTGAGSIGIHYDNATYWTEQMKARIFAQNCTQHVVFDVTGALTSGQSFGRADLDININQVNAAYDGVVLQNGSLIYDGEFGLHGNFVGSASALTSGALRITGTVPAGHPSAGAFAGIYDCRLDVGLECAANTHTPVTILFGNNSNLIKNCYGILDFGGDGAAANFTATARIGNLIPFNGITNGDAVLNGGTQGFQSGRVWGAAAGFALGDFTGATVYTSGQTIFPARAILRANPGGNINAMIIGAGSFDGQTIWIVNESAFTITFAASGTSHVADGVSDVIPALTARMYVFDGQDTNLWYRCA